MRYQTDEAILVKSSLPASEYRSGFDVAYPLAPMGIFQAQRRSPALTTAALTTALSPAPFGSSTFAPAVSPSVAAVATATLVGGQVRHRAALTDRPLLLSFKGSCAGKPRKKYAEAWRQYEDIVMLCTDHDKAASAKYNYHELQLRSRFALAPAGNGLHSSRLMEAVFLGAIPVLAEPELLLPFCDVVDWSLFSVRVPAERWREIPALLRAITPERLVEMQRQLAHARETYFENPMRTAVSLVWFRLQALRAASGGQNRTNTR